MEKILVITAHPDDAEFMFGGIINKYTRLGHKVDILIVTNGENWSKKGNGVNENLGIVRQNEAKKAAKVLKVNSVSFLNDKDGYLTKDDLINRLVDKVRIYNPSIILTHSGFEGHPDHIAVSNCITRICNQIDEPAPIKNPFWVSKEKIATNFKALFTHSYTYYGTQNLIKFVSLAKIDVDNKIKAALCHKSQYLDKIRIGEKITLEAQYSGILSGVKYAEVFNEIPQERFMCVEMLTN